MGAIVSMLTLVLPVILKIVNLIIDKKSEDENLKKDFLKLVDALDKQVPVNLRKNYQDQIDKLKEELKIEDINRKTIADAHANYKEAYEKLMLENEELKRLVKNG